MSDNHCTDEEARGLAQRWATWHAWAKRMKAAGDLDAEYEGPWDPHGEDERETLLGWVRGRMEREVSERYKIAFDEVDSPLDHARREAWSTDRVSLGRAVAVDLGGALAESTILTMALCEEAGWPS